MHTSADRREDRRLDRMTTRRAWTQVLRSRADTPTEVDRLRREVESLRGRLAKLNEASLGIAGSLDIDVVLQAVIDASRLLTGARYGAILTLDESREIESFITSGVSPEERRRMRHMPRGLGILGYMNETEGPLRLTDISSHARSVGFPENHPPMKSFLGISMRRDGKHFGNIYLAEKEGGGDFTAEDEESLAMFASQAAAAIANSHIYKMENRARADLEALLDISPVAVLVYDAKTRDLVSLNSEARRIVHSLQVPGRSLSQLLSVMTMRRPNGQDIPVHELPTERAIRSGETVRAEEMVIHLPDGKAIPVLCSVAPIRAEDGEVVSVVTTLQDMTPVEDLERLRAEYLDVVAQELRNPLTSVKGAVATVLNPTSSVDPVDARQYFRIVDQQVDRMSALIGSLLDLGRLETGTLSLNAAPVDVAEFLEEARRNFLARGARNTITVDIRQVPPPVLADRRRIVQVMANLFANASKHSPDWSEIMVSVWMEESYAVVSVADEGAGIAPEHLPHVFKKYTAVEPGGNGGPMTYEKLALAICRGIVEAHGGRMWVESEGPGLGATFSFSVPVADERQAPRPTPSPSRTSFPDSGGEMSVHAHVLVVDSDPQVPRSVGSSLLEAGYTSITTDDLEDAVHLVRTEEPDLVVLGRTLDLAEGVGLIRRVLEMSDIPVIILTDHDEDEFITRAFEAGAEDYIVKPFSPRELSARVRAVLSKRATLVRTKTGESFVLGELTIDYVSSSVSLGGRPVHLTPTEYKLLCELSMNAGRLLTYDHLLRRVWDVQDPSDTHVVRTFVKNLRQKLGDQARSPTYILTVPATGYRMPSP